MTTGNDVMAGGSIAGGAVAVGTGVHPAAPVVLGAVGGAIYMLGRLEAWFTCPTGY